MEKKIKWTRLALNDLNEIDDYIFNTTKSANISDTVIQQIIKSTAILSKHYLIYPLDKYKIPNDGSYRAYEFFHYRISYKVSVDEVYISSVAHSSRSPKIY
jgi:plasmid stabilization system protein ParE